MHIFDFFETDRTFQPPSLDELLFYMGDDERSLQSERHFSTIKGIKVHLFYLEGEQLDDEDFDDFYALYITNKGEIRDYQYRSSIPNSAKPLLLLTDTTSGKFDYNHEELVKIYNNEVQRHKWKNYTFGQKVGHAYEYLNLKIMTSIFKAGVQFSSTMIATGMFADTGSGIIALPTASALWNIGTAAHSSYQEEKFNWTSFAIDTTLTVAAAVAGFYIKHNNITI